MKERGYTFDSKSALAIAQTVQVVRHNPRVFLDLQGEKTNRIRESQFWAKITGSSTAAGVTKHSWTEQRRTATGAQFEDVPNGRTGTVDIWPAILPDLSALATGSIVRLALEVCEIVGGPVVVATIIASAGGDDSGVYLGTVRQVVAANTDGYDYVHAVTIP